ncbi:hypothetical protein ACIP2X_37630 [Streptomyces sp. NPDC089424]
MPHPHTDNWHALEEADERTWLDQWVRGQIDPDTLHPTEPALAAA